MPTPFALAIIIRGVLRLSLLPGPRSRGLCTVLDKAVRHLLDLETKVNLPQTFPLMTPQPQPLLPLPPHESHGLYPSPEIEKDLIWLWGRSIESLWRVSMTVEEEGLSAWEALTARLLLWRGMVGEERSLVGEWARRQVVRCMSA
jgi:nucleolar pre-ribosomal-associated protein 1